MNLRRVIIGVLIIKASFLFSLYGASYHSSQGTLPNAQGWILRDQGGSVPAYLTNGFLRIGPTSTSGDYEYFRTNVNFNLSTAFTMENRVRIIDSTTTANSAGYVMDAFDAFGNRAMVHIGNGSVILTSGRRLNQVAQVALTTTDWRTYRMVAKNGFVNLYVDGLFKAQVPLHIDGASDMNWATTVHFGNVIGSFTCTVDVDYFDYSLSANYPPSVALGLSSFNAHQIADGTGRIRLDYTLGLANLASASIGLVLSTNGGASWNIAPQSGSLSGDIGAVSSAGNKSIVWNASPQMPAGVFLSNMRARLTASAGGLTQIRDTPSFTLDLNSLNGGLAVAGRVLNATNRTPIAGATVTLAGQTTSSSAAGLFSFASVSLSSGNTLSVSKSGYATYSGTVPVSAGATAVTIQDVLLQIAPVGAVPVVTSITPKYDGLFLSGVSILNEYNVAVNWNGTTPSSVEFYVNGKPSKTVAAGSTGATAEIPMNLGFFGSLNVGANKLAVVAVGAGAERSLSFEQEVSILPLPGFLSSTLALGAFQFIPGNDPILSFDVQFPDKDIPSSALQTIPFLGRFGWQMAVGGGFEYALASGEWNLHAGLTPYGRWKNRTGPSPHSTLSNPKFFAGNRDITFEVMGQADGTATQTGGIQVGSLGVHLGVDFEQQILAFYLSDYVPGAQWIRVLDALKAVGADINSIQKVNVYGTLNAELDINGAMTPPPIHLQDATVNFAFGAKAAYEPDIIVAKGSVYLGGEIGPEFQIAPNFAFNKISGKVYGGITFTAFLVKIVDEQFVLLNYSWPAQAGIMASAQLSANDGWVLLPVKSDRRFTLDREYLHDGSEQFVGMDAPAKSLASQTVKLASDQMEDSVSALDAFRLIGQAAPGTVAVKGWVAQARGSSATNSKIGQADLPLLENVFPGSSPALAARGTELMLLYVTDNGNPNDLQFTDIRWTRFDGTNWTTPLTLHTNTQAEFAPQVVYDGNGDAIAVWERVANPNFNTPDLAAMAAQMEVVWAKWNHTSGQWSVPQALTANGYLDHAPLLCGPMSDDTVLTTWTANPSNLLMGTNGAGSQVLWSQWTPSAQSWSPPQTLLADLPNRLSQSLSGATNLAVYAWTRDMDGVLTNADDQQVFYITQSNGVWGAATQFTTSTNGNRNARVSVAEDGRSFLVWQNGTNLVLSQNFSNNTTLARGDSQTAGFSDYAMTIGPGGNLALLWQEMSQAGSDAHYRIYDPASATWSQDAQLFDDSPLERSFAPVWDDVGNLTVAYNKVQILYTNKTVILEGGGTVTITNVPQPGRVDLCVTKRQLIKDVALNAGDISASADNYLPGAAVTLSATLRNVGDVAVSNVVVAFYDGNPTNSGVLITNVTIPGWLEGAATNTVSVLWVVPEPATNHVVFAVADASGAITEFDEANNKLSLSLGGTDLAVSLVSQTAETNGAMRVIAQVQNLGAPLATNSVLAIRRAGETNAPLATVAVPLLEPGRLAQVALDLPNGTQPEGEQLYTLRADETAVTSDVDTNNNTTSFAVNLWIDSDGDGLPDSFEAQYVFLSSTTAADALLDYDGDGVSNLAEYRAGTAPNNPTSYLRMTGIASGGTNGVLVSWGSTTNKLYSLQRTVSLLLPFGDLEQHILSTPPENSYLDASATNGMQFFYRVKVE